MLLSKKSRSVLTIVILAYFSPIYSQEFLDILSSSKNEISTKGIADQKSQPQDNLSWRLHKVLVPELLDLPDTNKFYRGKIEELGIKYLDHLEYYIPQSTIPRIPPQELSIQDCTNLLKYGHYIEQSYEAPWYLKFINEKIGYGVFAGIDIPEGAYIGEYTGVVYDQQSFARVDPFDANYAWNIFYPWYYETPLLFIVDAKYSCNFTRFINHSFDPNVQSVSLYMADGWHIIYIACKAITKDQQLLVNYGEGYWKDKTPDPL